MSTAVMSSPMVECGELFKTKIKDSNIIHGSQMSINGNGEANSHVHMPLRRSYTSIISMVEQQHRKLDRSISEPTSRYKTELCRPYEENGVCKYGDKCQFAHGFSELRNLTRHPKYKTELCRTFHTVGFCPYGPRCHFVHNFEEARIHNQKVSAQLGSALPNIMGLTNSLLGMNAGVNTNANLNANYNSNAHGNLNGNLSMLDQLTSTTTRVMENRVVMSVVRKNSLNLANPTTTVTIPAATGPLYNSHQLLRTNSHGGFVGYHQDPQQQQQHVQQQHRQSIPSMGSSGIIVGTGNAKPLNLSPTFSLGSTAESISPTSSLSQSPTNSMANFFNDDMQAPVSSSVFSFGHDYGLLATRQTPSPVSVTTPITDDLAPRTPSPISPNAESRLPVFNRISRNYQ